MRHQGERASRSWTITHHQVTVNGGRYHYAEAGEGPLVVLVHGFPELWYSWRHQLLPLAQAGFRAVAPDLRGFGQSEVSTQVEDYSLLRHVDDVRALVDVLHEPSAVVVGHDWGANLTWAMALKYPSVVKAIIALSIPFYPHARDPVEMKKFSAGRFNFMTYFQQVGAAEAEFQENPRRFLRAFFCGLSGDAPAGTLERLYLDKPADAKLLDGFPQPASLPPWLTESDLDVYTDNFKKTGISGALGFYRNVEADYPALKELSRGTVNQPVLFIGGANEAAVRFGDLEPMKQALPNLRRVQVLPGCGHWVQQERAAEVNAAMIAFLNESLNE